MFLGLKIQPVCTNKEVLVLIYKLDYVLEKEDARRRDAAQAAAYASRAVRPGPGTLTYKLRRLAKELVAVYLTHQSWKAHDGIFTSIPLASARLCPFLIFEKTTADRVS